MMCPFTRITGILLILFTHLLAHHLVAQDDIADVVSQDRRIGDDEHKRYFSIEPTPDEVAPREGYGLVVILPGGDGSAEFLPFVKRIRKHATPDGFLVAQPVAIKWTPEQEIVWPTVKSRVDKMKFTTEEFVADVIKDVGTRHKLDPTRIFTLSWSSSGPAAYSISLTNPQVTGSFIAMSVFKKDLLPPLEQSKGHRYYLYHSPDDRVCPMWMAESAQKVLKEAGAQVELATYKGGHGWKPGLYDHIRTGIEWLEPPVE
ncbi:MAG: hypothetical protein R3C01_03560 [Planctomycetaceae bacterium]